MLWVIWESSFSVELVLVASLWDVFILLGTTTLLFYVGKLALTEFSWLRICLVSWMTVVSTFPSWTVPSLAPFIFSSDFISYIYHFSFLCCTFLFLGQFPFDDVFTDCHRFISTKRQQECTLCCLCELNSSSVETSHRLWKRSGIDDRSGNTSVMYTVSCGAGSEICGYHDNWNLTVLCVCGVMLFNWN